MKDAKSAEGPQLAQPAIPVSRYIVFFAIALGGGTLDLFTKYQIFQWRGMPHESGVWWIIEPYVGIETALNPGALFGMGANFGWLFATLSIAAAFLIIGWLFFYKAAQDLWLTIALGSVMGGIFGNLYDRLGFWHPPGMPGHWRTEVRDWMLLRYGQYTWPNFNIADCLLVTGAILLFIHGLKGETKLKGETNKTQS